MKHFLIQILFSCFLILLLYLFVGYTLTWGHEPNGYKHLEKDEFIGPHIMSAKFCPGSSEYMMWIVDKNGDNIADECNQVYGDHQTVHFKRWPAVNGVCMCEEGGL